ncbi:MAG: STAS domain-containing protein [Acidobacteria bacterium]|nr:STAS domain-containing protein [Acidobacteriota bacterium]
MIRICHLAMYLIVTILSPLSDGEFLDLQNNLNKQIQASRSQAVVMDVSGLDVMDSFTCRTLSDLSCRMKAQGKETAIIGIHPEIEESMKRFGLRLEHAAIATNLEEGLAVLGRRIATKRHGSN